MVHCPAAPSLAGLAESALAGDVGERAPWVIVQERLRRDRPGPAARSSEIDRVLRHQKRQTLQHLSFSVSSLLIYIFPIKGTSSEFSS